MNFGELFVWMVSFLLSFCGKKRKYWKDKRKEKPWSRYCIITVDGQEQRFKRWNYNKNGGKAKRNKWTKVGNLKGLRCSLWREGLAVLCLLYSIQCLLATLRLGWEIFSCNSTLIIFLPIFSVWKSKIE